MRERSDYGRVKSIPPFFRVFVVYLWSSEETIGEFSFLFFPVTRTRRQATVIRNLLDEQLAPCKDLYLTTFTTNIQATDRIWTHDPSKRAAADVRLRLRSHWDRQSSDLFIRFIKQKMKYPSFLYQLSWLASHTVFYCDSGDPVP